MNKLTCDRHAQYATQVMFKSHLGETFAISLTCRDYLYKITYKLNPRNKPRNNIHHKISGGRADATAFRNFPLALVYAMVEYCCIVWLNNGHTNIVYIQVNESIRNVIDTIKFTPFQWLLMLANILPSEIRRKITLLKKWWKCYNITLLAIMTY